ncbi:uncharacterized protein B0P05DRAFT_554091 [Gilbertella persicaria]|uniref:uncharacterized protein n=1 Tax=Gilbertella persicaria TaxID=101096 RepID=UPI002220609A|nr:uncharacterized protein B0P05DRAFT_554091 [Gilbertella persicaria]KAI8065373.1 hypothetical protein B0P05DRAFT_554091 [Gilbertella persicaria]
MSTDSTDTRNALDPLSSLDNMESSVLNKLDLNTMQQDNLASKRYSLSQEIKDNFYAIRHINEENENTAPTKKSTRGRKRLTADAKTNEKPQEKRKKQRKTRATLYQTCSGVWPDSHHSLGDLSHDYIKSLSQLVKVRLNQAKFKMMAKLDHHHELFSFLAEELVPPTLPKKPHVIRLSGKQNKTAMSVVGNGKNLFARNKSQQKRRPSVTYTEAIFELPSTPMDPYGLAISPSRQTPKTSKDRKKRTHKVPNTKPKRITTPKRRSAAADVIPVTLSDGTSVYVCEPCNKRYKNRNGLAYHMERCKNTPKNTTEKEESNNSSSSSSSSSSQSDSHRIQCNCGQNTDDTMNMIQCEKCRLWLHSECVGLSEEEEDAFYCSKCKEQSEANQVGKDLLQCLLEAQANDRLLEKEKPNEDDTGSQLLQEFLSQTPLNEDDELFSVHTAEEQINSSQLHIWDDFNVNSGFDKNNDQWKLIDEEDPFSTNYDTDLPSSSWNMSLFSQPPSLLFSDTTLNSTLDDKPLMEELTPDTAQCESTTPIQATPDGLWFQFANFDDDYQQCESS